MVYTTYLWWFMVIYSLNLAEKELKSGPFLGSTGRPRSCHRLYLGALACCGDHSSDELLIGTIKALGVDWTMGDNGCTCISPNSVATLKGSYGNSEGPVFNRGGIRRVWLFWVQFQCSKRQFGRLPKTAPGTVTLAYGMWAQCKWASDSCATKHLYISSWWLRFD